MNSSSWQDIDLPSFRSEIKSRVQLPQWWKLFISIFLAIIFILVSFNFYLIKKEVYWQVNPVPEPTPTPKTAPPAENVKTTYQLLKEKSQEIRGKINDLDPAQENLQPPQVLLEVEIES
jgi:hypothetical protein